jgi:REP element-mobilizing transposase RayT
MHDNPFVMMQVYLYVHVIWSTAERVKVLTKPVRVVLFTHLKQYGEEKGIRILKVDGAAEHAHLLLQLHPAQNLSQVLRQLKAESEEWLNSAQLLKDPFKWSDELIAYSVSPGSLQQVIGFIDRQDEYHQTRTFEAEIEGFLKMDKEGTT